MDASTRSPRSAPRLSSEGHPSIDRSPEDAFGSRLSSWLFRGALFLFGPASAFGQIPVGPFCGDLSTSVTQQTASLLQDGVSSTCPTAKTCPGTTGGSVAYIANSFTNTTGADACVTVSGTSTCTTGGGVMLAAYLGSFDPNNICTNYAADGGNAVDSGASTEFSFIVANGATFVVVASGDAAACGEFCFTIASAPCSITCPDNITVGTGAGATECGTNVTWDIGLPCGGAPSCTVNGGTPVASGDFFPVGTTTVTCTGANAQCSFDVTVNDTTPPAIVCPANITVGLPSNACSATVSYSTPSASDNCPDAGPVQVVCAPASGSTFPLGTTQVTCTATDAAQNQSSCQFDITVNGGPAPTITCPANITASAAPDACSGTLRYTTPTASTTCGPASVVCAPASGSTFPVGQTMVTCTATTAGGASSQCSFTVTVNDTQPPSITCPADISALADANGSSRKVDYPDPDFADNCPDATVACVPASGSTFPVGETTVTCTATDAHQNTAQCTFRITVRPNPVVPTLDPRVLAGLAAALAAVGALLARRR